MNGVKDDLALDKYMYNNLMNEKYENYCLYLYFCLTVVISAQSPIESLNKKKKKEKRFFF